MGLGDITVTCERCKQKVALKQSTLVNSSVYCFPCAKIIKGQRQSCG